jgi:hypothetical protein
MIFFHKEGFDEILKFALDDASEVDHQSDLFGHDCNSQTTPHISLRKRISTSGLKDLTTLDVMHGTERTYWSGLSKSLSHVCPFFFLVC